MKKHEYNHLSVFIDTQNLNQAIVALGWKIDYKKFFKILAPSVKNYSSLLRRLVKDQTAFVSDLRNKIEYKDNGRQTVHT